MVSGLSFSTLCLFIRYVRFSFPWVPAESDTFPVPDSAIYRTIELADGWNGRIIRTEVYFSKFFPPSLYPMTRD